MKILLLIPPYIPSYFNAGHHLPLFQVAAFLRTANPSCQVCCWDGAALNAGWKELCDLLVQGHDAIGLLNDFDGVDTFPRTLDYIAELCPLAKRFTFGRLSKQIPMFFRKFDLDAVVESGDYEASVSCYLKFLTDRTSNTPGVWIRDMGLGQAVLPGLILSPEQWTFPDVREIPYPEYRRLYHNDLNKYCGIPNCLELVVPVARGCPIGCAYCDVPFMQGSRERRVSVESTMAYIEDALRIREFDYISFYAPTFTLRRDWVLRLCDEIASGDVRFPWKCVTTLAHLDRPLLEQMATAGCVRVSIGLETLDPLAASALPMLKRNVENDFDRIAEACRDVGIELNCFVILGLPGDTLEGVRYTVRRVLERGARIRPTVYTPYNEMRSEMSLTAVARFNRQLFVPGSPGPEGVAGYYQLLYANPADRATPLADTVPVARRHAG